MDGFDFWRKWLFVVGIIVVIFGVLLALFSGTPLFDIMHQQVNPVFWYDHGPCHDARLFQLWIYGVLGATVASWGVALAFIAYYPFRNKEKWSWNCVMLGLLLWYFIDTPLSWYDKVYFNVIFNSIVFLAALLPLIFTRRYFASPGHSHS